MSLPPPRATLKNRIADRIPGGANGRRLLWITLVDKAGTGLWAATAALYFTYVTDFTVAEVGILVALSAGIGVAGAPIGGLLADRFPLTRVLIVMQTLRGLASLALLTTDHYGLLLALASAAGFGDRAANVLTKLYAARIAGPDRVRYQAVNRTVANIGFAIGGIAAAAALGIGTTTAYRSLLIGNAVASLTAALLTLRCAEAPSATRVVHTSHAHAGPDGTPATDKPASPWRDRTYLAYTATETVLLLDDTIFKVGLPLWIVHATDAPPGLAPLLLVLNNVLVVALQIPLARFGATTPQARRLLLPLAALFAAGTLALSLSTPSTANGPWLAAAALTLAATALTLAEMLHAIASWELSIALTPTTAQGAYLGVHGLATSAQRGIGPLLITAVLAAGPAGWALLGAGLSATCLAQHRLIRRRLAEPALSVPNATVSHT
ncbi:MFS transporter [Streptomyces sp. PR69]|uniref:MFS transporter n=1 Tax=Streptomyces sp. PR69 TaxID=2984950 RepID=UPI002B26E4DB|nr:MFS transporter [Streptomyces sp. PR69]